jgi:hypothetical protein
MHDGSVALLPVLLQPGVVSAVIALGVYLRSGRKECERNREQQCNEDQADESNSADEKYPHDQHKTDQDDELDPIG